MERKNCISEEKVIRPTIKEIVHFPKTPIKINHSYLNAKMAHSPFSHNLFINEQRRSGQP